jgi:putative FmdB family regulatory protein
MPLYDFKCPTCGKVIELLVNRGEPDRLLCPDCNELMDKQIGAVSIQFKGPGFYSTDYKNKR